MKKLLVLAALMAAFGFAATAFAQCSACNYKKAHLTQELNVSVPTVMSLILDNNYSASVNATTGDLGTWKIDLTHPLTTYANNNCYVVPNWVAADGSNLLAWMTYAENHGGLFPASNSKVKGYPAALVVNNKVITWGQISSAFAAYNTGSLHADAHAKGNIVCRTQIQVEKYTNCPSAQFAMQLQSTNQSTSGFGTLFVQDKWQFNGMTTHGASPVYAFQKTHGDTYYKLVDNIPQGTFVDDTINQTLWLGNSQPGTYDLVATYTLGSALF